MKERMLVFGLLLVIFLSGCISYILNAPENYCVNEANELAEQSKEIAQKMNDMGCTRVMANDALYAKCKELEAENKKIIRDWKELSCTDDSQLLINEAQNNLEENKLPLEEKNNLEYYLTEPKEVILDYTLRGKTGSIQFTAYKGLNDYLADKSRSYVCSPACPSQEEIALKQINEFSQEQELKNLVQLIQEKTSVKDDQARIAISLVQKIDYDNYAVTTGNLTARYPYEVLYSGKGVCGEKAKLLAFILRELGYGVVLFNYSNHQALGVKCKTEYSLNSSGYCFVETARTTIPTNNKEEYVLTGKLPEAPDSIYNVSDGIEFESITEEYSDAREWLEIKEKGTVLSQYWYNEWKQLVNKYGIETETQ